MKKQPINNILSLNRKAKLKYLVIDKLEAGIVLTGSEVKAAKNKNISINDSYAQIKQGEVWLINTRISPYKFSSGEKENDPTRTRKLLLKRQEISHLADKIRKGISLIPLKVYQNKGIVKIELALAKGLKKYSKKNLLKERDLKKQASQELKKIL